MWRAVLGLPTDSTGPTTTRALVYTDIGYGLGRTTDALQPEREFVQQVYKFATG